MRRELRALFAKEWRQLVRSKGAMASSLLLPLLIMVVIPAAQMITVSKGTGGINVPPGTTLPPALAMLATDPKAMPRLMLVLMVGLGGLLVPSLAASYTIVAERETRTLELLVALPVRIADVLWAKLLALLALATLVTFVLLGIDSALVLAYGIAGPLYLLSLAAVLVTSLALSCASALLVSLLAKDFRTANNLNGVVFGPLILISGGVLLALPSATLGALTLAGIYGALALGCALVAVRVVTFERLLR